MYQASLTHACGHTFCGSCITKWLGKSNICPVCRAPVQATTSCLTVDNFITNLCNLIGGTVQEQRENLQKESQFYLLCLNLIENVPKTYFYAI